MLLEGIINDNDLSLLYRDDQWWNSLHEDLIDACVREELDDVKYLIENNSVEDFRNPSKNPVRDAYYIACVWGHLPIAQYLESKDLKDPVIGRFYYLAACRSGNLDLVRHLMEDQVVPSFNESLYNAFKSGNVELVKYLLDLTSVRRLISNDDNSDVTLTLDPINIKETSAHSVPACLVLDSFTFRVACESGLEMVQLLIDRGLAPTEPYTPTYCQSACMSGDLELIRLFQEHAYSIPVYHQACKSGNLELVKYIQGGLREDIPITEQTIRYSYSNAIESGSIDLVEYMFGQEMRDNYPHLTYPNINRIKWLKQIDTWINSGNLPVLRYGIERGLKDIPEPYIETIMVKASRTGNYSLIREVFCMYGMGDELVKCCSNFSIRRKLLLYRCSLRIRAKSAYK